MSARLHLLFNQHDRGPTGTEEVPRICRPLADTTARAGISQFPLVDNAFNLPPRTPKIFVAS